MGEYYAKVFMNTFQLLQAQLSDMSITAGILSLFCWTQKQQSSRVRGKDLSTGNKYDITSV